MTYDDSNDHQPSPVLQRLRQAVAATVHDLGAGDLAPDVVEAVMERHGDSMTDMICGLVLAAMADLDDSDEDDDSDSDEETDDTEIVEGELT